LDLTLNPDQSFFQETTRRFLEGEAPLTRVRELADDPAGFDRGWWRRGAELGQVEVRVEERGGDGLVLGPGRQTRERERQHRLRRSWVERLAVLVRHRRRSLTLERQCGHVSTGLLFVRV